MNINEIDSVVDHNLDRADKNTYTSAEKLLQNYISNLYRDSKGKYYYFSNGKYKTIRETDITRNLTHMYNKNQTERALILNEILEKNYIDCAGPYVGQKLGRINICNTDYLVTKERNELEKDEHGTWDNVKIFIESLFDHDPEQLDFFYGWLQIFLKTLDIPNSNRMGQCPIIIGERNCGKTMLLEHILRPLIGYNIGDPTNAFLNPRTFNGNSLNEALYVLDDIKKASTLDSDSISDGIKEFAFRKQMRVEPKGVDAFEAIFPKRVIICSNTERKHITMLPKPTDDSIRDKVSYMYANIAKLPSKDPEENVKVLESELPAFYYWLMEIYKIPSHMENTRTGVKSIFNKKALSLINSNDQDLELIELLGTYLGVKDSMDFTCKDLYEDLDNSFNPNKIYQLKNTQTLRYALERLMKSPTMIDRNMSLNVLPTRTGDERTIYRLEKISKCSDFEEAQSLWTKVKDLCEAKGLSWQEYKKSGKTAKEILDEITN